jgi:hypothetical protein
MGGTAPHRVGVSGSKFTEQREAVYQELWGEAESVSHELLPLEPHIDVFLYREEFEERTFFRLVTAGMSDLPMQLPDGEQVRAELVMYVPKIEESYVEMLRFLAHYPHDNRRWLYFGHTLPNGHPPSPFFESSKLSVALIANSVVARDNQLNEQLILDGTAVELMCVIPITEAECNLKLERGADALYELFNETKLPFILDERRRSLV